MPAIASPYTDTSPAPSATPSATSSATTPSDTLPCPSLHSDRVPELVAQVFEEAPASVRGRLLEHLLKPLGLLSLAAVANGVFARVALGDGWYQPHVSADDARRINAMDVIALVHHVQQVSVQAVEGLVSVISTSPLLTGSATAAMLLSILHKQSQSRPPVLGNDFDPLG